MAVNRYTGAQVCGRLGLFDLNILASTKFLHGGPNGSGNFDVTPSRLTVLRALGHRRAYLAYGLVGLGLLIVLVLAWPRQTSPPASDACKSARPAIRIDFGQGVDRGSPFASQLSGLLASSPLLAVRHDLDEGCKGVPAFALAVSRQSGEAGAISTRLLDAVTADVVWESIFRPEATPGEDPEAILAARIAYRLNEPNGVIAAKAAAMRWTNEAAFREFTCLLSINQIYFAANKKEANAVYACMKRYAFQSSQLNMAAQFAALDVYRNQPAFNSGYFILSDAGRKAYERVERLSPQDRELLGLKLRQYRIDKPINISHIIETFSIIDKIYHYDPVMQAFAAMTCGAYIDNYQCAYDRTRLANMIAPEQDTLSWGRIFANLAQQKWPDLVQDRNQIMGFTFFEDALIAQAMAPYGPSPQTDQSAARAWLAKDNLESAPRLRDKIARLEYSNSVKMALFDIVQDHYESDPSALDPSALDPSSPSSAWAIP